MPLTPGQRIEMISQSATLLDAMDWVRLDLVLTEHGFRTWSQWEEDTRYEYLTNVIRNGDEADLTALHAYLLDLSSEVRAITESPFPANKLRVFMSHLSTQKALVGDAARLLDGYGVHAFVAHQSIDISKEWQRVIEDALSDCDAMAVFLHSGFRESQWCDQELGWVMGRTRPVMILGFDNLNPHGFAGKFQALPATGLGGGQAGAKILDWLTTQPTVRARLAESLTIAFQESSSYDRTRALIARLEAIDTFTDEQLSRIEDAVRSNSQVRDAGYNYEPVPRWVASFVSARRSPGTEGWGVADGASDAF